MEKILITGGRRLEGKVETAGSKNACLPILLATLLADGTHTVARVPHLKDVLTTFNLLAEFGVGCRWVDHEKIEVEVRSPLTSVVAPYDLVRTMRASVLALGPLVGRFGEAKVSMPGGCAIGSRPVDQHIKGLEKLGCRIQVVYGYLEAKAPEGLVGAKIVLDMPTVTGTENLLMAAVLAHGMTVIENAAREPEIVDLAGALSQMGAKISGAGTSTIEIQGVTSLAPMNWTVIPDRIEAGTFCIAGAITRGDVTVTECQPGHLHAFLEKLREMKVEVETGEDWVRVQADGPPRPVRLATQVHPGFPTDLQAQTMALLSLADGASLVTESVFENRFMHVAELQRMGADLTIEGSSVVVQGVPSLQAAPLLATDLRASACLILAALAAEGTSAVRRIYHLDRGYERMEEKLHGLGAAVERVTDPGERY